VFDETSTKLRLERSFVEIVHHPVLRFHLVSYRSYIRDTSCRKTHPDTGPIRCPNGEEQLGPVVPLFGLIDEIVKSVATLGVWERCDEIDVCLVEVAFLFDHSGPSARIDFIDYEHRSAEFDIVEGGDALGGDSLFESAWHVGKYDGGRSHQFRRHALTVESNRCCK
jgi:hypothetical protein